MQWKYESAHLFFLVGLALTVVPADAKLWGVRESAEDSGKEQQFCSNFVRLIAYSFIQFISLSVQFTISLRSATLYFII